jgi:hypothetical protein
MQPFRIKAEGISSGFYIKATRMKSSIKSKCPLICLPVFQLQECSMIICKTSDINTLIHLRL